MTPSGRRIRIALTVMFALYATMQFYVLAKADAALALTWPVLTLLVALTYLPFVLETSFGATPLGIGGVFAAASVATAVASFSLGALARRIGLSNLIIGGFVLYLIVLACVPLAPALWLIVLLAMGFGFANGMTIPSLLILVAGTTSGRHRGVIMSVNGMLLRLGQTLGPLFAGAAFGLVGLAGTFWVSAGLALGMLGVLTILRPGNPRTSGEPITPAAA